MHHVAKFATLITRWMPDVYGLNAAFYFNRFPLNGLWGLLVSVREQDSSNGTLIALKLFRWQPFGSESQIAACLTLVS
jgi:hypothetical protein